MKKAKTELVDKGFSQKILDKHTNLPLFTTDFTPIISTKRIIPRMKWLELVYALPYLVLRREILNSFKKTKNVLASVKQMWNIFVHLEFPLSRHREIVEMQDARCKMQVKPESGIQYPASFYYLNLVKSRGFYFESSSMELAQPVNHETTRIETEKEPTVTNHRLPVVNYNPPVVSHKPPAVRYEDQATYILRSTSDITTPLFSYYSFKSTLFLSQKTVPVKEREVSLIPQKSDAVYLPYEHLEGETLQQNGQKIIQYLRSSSMELAQPVSTETTRIETGKESLVINYKVPVVITQPLTVSHKASAAVSYKKSDAAYRPYGHLERETLQNGQKMISYFKSSSMELTQPVSHGTSTSRIETESTVASYPVPLVTTRLPVVSHKPPAVRYEDQATYIPTSTSDLITPLFSYYSAQKIKTGVGEKAIYDILPYFNFRSNKQMHTSEVEKAHIYHTYPEIEHVTSTHTEIKERVIEKGEESEPPHATPQLPSIDVNRLADQVYSVIERKVRIERERRGL